MTRLNQEKLRQAAKSDGRYIAEHPELMEPENAAIRRATRGTLELLESLLSEITRGCASRENQTIFVEVSAMKWTDRVGRRLRLNDLHMLLTVAESGSMGKAAEALGISQPSVSKAISDIEHEMGVRLLDRFAHGVVLTPYGQALVTRGVSVFDELRQGLKEIDILSDPTAGEVSIGCPEAIASGVLGAVLARFCTQFPRVVVNVEAATNVAHEYQLLRRRKVDLLLGEITRPFAEEDLDAQVIYEDRPYVTTGATNRLALRRRVEVAELLEEQWVLPGESFLRSFLQEALEAKGFVLPKIGVKSYSVHQRISLLATGRFVSADSRSVLRYNGAASSVILLPVDLPIRSWPVAIVTLKDRTANPVVQTFVDCVRDVSKPLAEQIWVGQATARSWSTPLA
jgi:DNA-binding transcriptional LysR family regulator